MPLPNYIQYYLRQYNNVEASWGGIYNTGVMNNLLHAVTLEHNEEYVLSRQFVTDMHGFVNRMYTPAQLQMYPTPLPARTCRNAIRCLRRRIRSRRFT